MKDEDDLGMGDDPWTEGDGFSWRRDGSTVYLRINPPEPAAVAFDLPLTAKGVNVCPLCGAEMSPVDMMMPSLMYGNEYSVIRDGHPRLVCAACVGEPIRMIDSSPENVEEPCPTCDGLGQVRDYCSSDDCDDPHCTLVTLHCPDCTPENVDAP